MKLFSWILMMAMGLTAIGCARAPVERHGMIAFVKADRVERLRELNARVPREVDAALRRHHIGAYTIYLKELEKGKFRAFCYLEYGGRDYHADMARVMEESAVREWNRAMAECLDLSHASSPTGWREMEEVFYFDGQVEKQVAENSVERRGMVIGLRPDMIESYKQLHAHPWRGVLDAIRNGNIRNYPIYLTRIGDRYYLFSYFEYVGDDFEADMAAIGADPITKAWIRFTDIECQLPISMRAEGEWWANMEEIYHMAGSEPVSRRDQSPEI